MSPFLRKSLSVFIITALVVSNNSSIIVFAQEPADQKAPQASAPIPSMLSLVIGDVEPIETKNLTRVAVTNPDIVDLTDVKAEGVFIVGKKAGQTEVFVWDDTGKHSVIIHVAIEDLNTLETRVQDVIEKAQIKGVSLDKNINEGKLALFGAISKEDKDSLDKIMDPYSDRIINLVKILVNENMIQIDAQIVEISTDLEKKLGLDWFTGSQTIDATGHVTTTGESSFTPSYLEVQPSFDGSIGDFFKIGKFYRAQNTAFGANLNALISDGKARVLSKPRLVVKNGKEASFLVGGEIPISTSTLNGTTTASNITFKQYGVNMVVTPTIKDDKIDITLNVKITDIDRSAPTVSGDVGYTSREAQTQLFLDNKQTIILAGLIKHNDNDNVRKIAYLGDIPILGLLFRSRDTPKKDTELIISLTPTILKNKVIATDQVKMPSPRLDSFQKQVESNFERESLDEKPVMPEPVKVTPLPFKIPEMKPTTVVLTPSKVPSMMVLDYVRTVQLKISQAISYPAQALQKNWEGTVKLRLRILKDGSLADCDVLESSKHDAFDADAKKTAKTIAPYLPFPEGMAQDDIVVTVPIVYSRQGASKNDTQTVVASY